MLKQHHSHNEKDVPSRLSHFCLPCIACDCEVYGLFYFGLSIEAIFFVMTIFREVFCVSVLFDCY